VYKVNDPKALARNSARYWFIGLLFALTADLYRLRNNMQRLTVVQKLPRDDEGAKKERATLKKYVKYRIFLGLT
jgi:hypothetical protein